MNTPHENPQQPSGPDQGGSNHDDPVGRPTGSQGEEPAAEPAPEFAPASGGHAETNSGTHSGASTGTPPTQELHESAKFFQWIRSVGVQRASNRWVGGVCSGLADKWGIDPVIVRGLLVVLTIFFGVGVLFYGLAWALLPEPDGRIHVEEVSRGRWSSGMTGAGIMTLVGLIDPARGFVFNNHDGGWPWALFWMAAVVWFIYWIVTRDKSKYQGSTANQANQAAPDGPDTAWPTTPAPLRFDASQSMGQAAGQSLGGPDAPPFRPDPRQYIKVPPAKVQPVRSKPVRSKPVRATPRLGAAGSLLVLGLAAVVGAVLLLLDATGVINLGGYQVSVAAAAAAITAAVAIIAAGVMGRTANGLGIFAMIAVVCAGMFGIPVHGGSVNSFAATSWTPTSISTAEAGTTVVFGTATLDLTRLTADTPLSADVQIPLDVVASNVTLQLPNDIPVQLKSQLAAASVTLNGDKNGGALAQESTVDLNPSATGHGLVITLQGVAANINVTTSAPVEARP